MNDQTDAEVRAEREIVHRYLAQATPQQWHLYAARSNYDGNRDTLEWMAEQSRLPRATALLMYWALGAGYHAQYASEDEVPGWAQRAHRLIRRIETRYLAGFYSDSTIYFDPDDGPVPPGDYADLITVRRAIPPAMYDIVSGSDWVDFDDEAYDDGLPLAVAEDIQALFDRDD